ncbi:MAG: hypothetical protein OER56_00275 [Hyphomicrobiales bacterium]|nr:hypothetical protein [Hyphomicrobiales bacterium]
MKKLSVIAALAAFALAGTLGYTVAPLLAGSKVFAQEDCADGETWNETTGMCEKGQ